MEQTCGEHPNMAANLCLLILFAPLPPYGTTQCKERIFVILTYHVASFLLLAAATYDPSLDEHKNVQEPQKKYEKRNFFATTAILWLQTVILRLQTAIDRFGTNLQ